MVILAFVGIQLAWNLRPFLGDRGKDFELFREYEGNFYAALIYSVNKLISGEDINSTNPQNSETPTDVKKPNLEF